MKIRIEAALRPGSKLDALIAERVMGWSKEGSLYRTHEGALRSLEHFMPSTSMTDAWMVAQLVADRWDNLATQRVFNVQHDPESMGWYVVLEMDRHGDPILYEYGETAAHAICLAALITVTQQ
jgi:hypothetical protein